MPGVFVFSGEMVYHVPPTAQESFDFVRHSLYKICRLYQANQRPAVASCRRWRLLV